MAVQVGDVIGIKVASNPDYYHAYIVDSMSPSTFTARNMFPARLYKTQRAAERAGRDHLVGPLIARGMRLTTAEARRGY